MLKRFKNSLYLLLKTLYPEHEWLEWKFKYIGLTTLKSYWSKPDKQKTYFDWVLHSSPLYIKKTNQRSNTYTPTKNNNSNNNNSDSISKLTPEEQEIWYPIQWRSIIDRSSPLENELFEKYHGSLYRALSTVYPNTIWHPWKFTGERLEREFWNDQQHLVNYFDWLEKQLNIQNKKGWYYIGRDQVLFQYREIGFTIISISISIYQ